VILGEHWLRKDEWTAVCVHGTDYGVFYAPPFTALALTELLFPDEWTLFPDWGGSGQ